MYAIVKTGGKQYRVEEGQTLLVERLPDDAGATVSLEPILFRSDDVVFDSDGLAKVKVDAKIVEHLRGEKLRVFKFKPKRGYRKRNGHRQELTRIEEAGRSAATAVLVEGQPASANGAPAKSGDKSEAKASEEKPAPRKRVRTTRPKPAAKADEEPASGDEEAAADGDDVESTPRRRGRRGGRRRSAAKAEATSD